MSPVVTFSERAIAQVRRHLTAQPAGTALRIGIRRTGCSGYAYTLDYAADPPADKTADQAAGDAVVAIDGITVRIAADALPVLTGSAVDYVRDGLNEKFVFANPNAGDQCGCGESFALRA
jgi:iron-sulfur cluster assembly protein